MCVCGHGKRLRRVPFYDVVVAFTMFWRGCGSRSGYLSQPCFMAVINCRISMAILRRWQFCVASVQSAVRVIAIAVLQKVGHALVKVMAVFNSQHHSLENVFRSCMSCWGSVELFQTMKLLCIIVMVVCLLRAL